MWDRSEDARQREGATPTSDHQPQPQDSTLQGDRRIMRRSRAQGREAENRIAEGGGGAKKRKNPKRVTCRRDLESGGALGGRRKKRRQESTGSVDIGPEDLENVIEQQGIREGSARRSGLK